MKLSEQIRELIGPAAAAKLGQRFGGTRIYISRSLAPKPDQRMPAL